MWVASFTIVILTKCIAKNVFCIGACTDHSRFNAVAITLNVSTRWSVHGYTESFNAVVGAWLH